MSDWCKALKPAAQDAQPLAGIGDLNPVPASTHRAPALRPSAVFSVLLSIAAVSLLFVRLAPGGKVSGAALSASAMHARTELATQTDESYSTNVPNSFATHPTAAPSTPRHGMPLVPSEYHVAPGQHFAEIRVHRPAHAGSDAQLTWWTEPASAKPGVDYVSQAKVSQAFPKGQDSMSVFVKLLPKAERSQAEVFYVAVADKSGKQADLITHTAVHLPSRKASF